MIFRQIAEILLLIAYVWTIVLYFQISGIIAAILSAMFPFFAPAYGFVIYYFTDDAEIAQRFIAPNALNLVSMVFLFVYSFNKNSEEKEEGDE